jgi:serine/threonine-protein phosphatase 5
LWSDPAPPGVMGRQPSKRGNGVCFGADVTYRFLDSNGLQMVVRSHEVKDKGYEFDCNNRLVTVNTTEKPFANA